MTAVYGLSYKIFANFAARHPEKKGGGYFRKTRKFTIAVAWTDLIKRHNHEKKHDTSRALRAA